ncbi:MAG: signal peptidase I [Lachnospiraceae bacterium]|nr:signal peptidase I [Lachnospiraceae bacterium]
MKKNGSFLVYVLWNVFIILLILVSVFAIVKYFYQPIQVEGSSMEPNLYETDKLLINKVGNKLEYERYDIIVFKPYSEDNLVTKEVDESDALFIKRIIGLPGETVQIMANGDIFITDKNGKKFLLEDDPAKQDYYYSGIDWVKYDDNMFESITLKDDEYFVLGDNRDVSKDSRSSEIEAVNCHCIIGKFLFKMPF